MELLQNKIFTHGGVFHADEVTSTAILKQISLLKENPIEITRGYKVPEGFDGLVYDIGHGEYDHHQQGGNGARENGIKYSSCGLIWRDFGKELLKLSGIKEIDKVWEKIDGDIIQSIDAHDNGQEYNQGFSYSNIINQMNPEWDSDKSADELFNEAVEFATKTINTVIEKELSKERARGIVENALINSNDHVMILDQYVPYKDILKEINEKDDTGMLHVIYPSQRGGYNVDAVAKPDNYLEQLCPFIEDIRGKSEEEIREITGIDGVTFVHNAGFIAATKDLPTALKLAEYNIRENFKEKYVEISNESDLNNQDVPIPEENVEELSNEEAYINFDDDYEL